MKKAILYTLVFLAMQAIAGGVVLGLAQLISPEWAAKEQITLQIVTLIVFSLATIFVFLHWKWAEVARSYVRSRPWTVLSWTVVAAVGVVIPSMWTQEILPELPNFVEDQMSQIMGNRMGYVAIGLLAPVTEEIVFRGAILRRLLETGGNRWAMIAISALLFAVAHLNPAQMPHAFVIGLLLGWMYCRTKSVVPAVAFHWANNTIAYALFRFYPDPTLKLTDILGSDRAVLMAVGFSLLILLPALYQLYLRMKPAKG